METPAVADVLSSYAGLLVLATVTIYAGSFGSLPKPPRVAGASKEQDDDDEDEEDAERISAGDAWLFPVLGSGVLIAFYLIFKYLGTEWINWLIGWYFALAGVLAVWKTSVALCRGLLPEARWKSFTTYRVLILKGAREQLNVSLKTPSLIIFLPSLIPSALYIFLGAEKKPALLSNILALSFSYTSLCLLKLDTFRTGCILLSGLFVYDIWWVFGTDVMVKVATTLDAPIKILWPKSLVFSPSAGMSILGLGDIVIPGAFVSLALRYDLARSPAKSFRVPFAKPYFTAAMFAYVAGLLTTMTVMHTFKAAQPALLYLSPACMLSFFLTALARGELQQGWSWEDTQNDATVAKDAPAETEAAAVPPSEAPAQAPVVPAGVDPSSDADEVEEEDKPRKRKTRKKKA